MLSTIKLYMETNHGLICDLLVFWIQIAVESFACFNTQISVFDYMCFTVLFHTEVEDHYADGTYICNLELHQNQHEKHAYIILTPLNPTFT